MRNIFALILVMVTLSGCVNGSALKFNDMKVGMTKAEVIDKLGQPSIHTAKDGADYYNYRFFEVVGGDYIPYYVKLVDDRVVSFARVTDVNPSIYPRVITKIETQKNFLSPSGL